MANLYLIDKRFGQNGLNVAAGDDDDAQVVLIQDGVYLDTASLATDGKKIYAVKQDVEKRGLQERISPATQLVDYGELVDLLLSNKVINFA